MHMDIQGYLYREIQELSYFRTRFICPNTWVCQFTSSSPWNAKAKWNLENAIFWQNCLPLSSNKLRLLLSCNFQQLFLTRFDLFPCLYYFWPADHWLHLCEQGEYLILWQCHAECWWGFQHMGYHSHFPSYFNSYDIQLPSTWASQDIWIALLKSLCFHK